MAEPYDVAIVGYGPVGAILANLLGQAGRRVVVVEREASIYDLPRAVHFDGEIMRVFQSAGLARAVSGIIRSIAGAEFVRPSGERLLGIDSLTEPRGPAGWAPANLFYQPHLELILREGVGRFANVTVRLRHEATAIEQLSDRVRVTLRDAGFAREETVEARYLIGADGAASFTRRQAGIRFESLDYDREWLVIDAMLKRPVELPDLVQQICDPERPTTFVPSAGAHRRWEFQLRGEETREEMERPQRVWELLEPWLGPEDADVIRAVVYEFHGTLAERWRDGRVLLIGDAAHQMPPFLGQGMCSGIRDAANLCWKLCAVLDGRAPERLLDTYESERKPHADDIVEWAIAVGKLIDAFAHAEAGAAGRPGASLRDAGYGGGRRMGALGPGLLQRDAPPDGPVGQLFPQSLVRTPDGAERLCDELLGPGFALVVRGHPTERIGPEADAFWKAQGARLVDLDDVELLDAWTAPVFASATTVVVRPDRYVAGVASSPSGLDALTRELRPLLEP